MSLFSSRILASKTGEATSFPEVSFKKIKIAPLLSAVQKTVSFSVH
jgi:hypothetical protein